MELKVNNHKLIRAGFHFSGQHQNKCIKLLFDNFEIKIDVNNCDVIQKVFNIFDKDPQNGMYLDDIKGYCRVGIDDERYIQAIQHITNDKLIIDKRDFIQ